MRCSVVIGVMSDDRPGIVETLSKVINAHDGKWSESKMVAMSGKFAGILQVDVPCTALDSLTEALDSLADQGMNIRVEPNVSYADAPQVMREFHLELVGLDRPGIIREITQLLVRHGINLKALDTEVQNASMSGEIMFFARARTLIPESVNLKLLQSEFEQLANELMVDIQLKE